MSSATTTTVVETKAEEKDTKQQDSSPSSNLCLQRSVVVRGSSKWQPNAFFVRLKWVMPSKLSSALAQTSVELDKYTTAKDLSIKFDEKEGGWRIQFDLGFDDAAMMVIACAVYDAGGRPVTTIEYSGERVYSDEEDVRSDVAAEEKRESTEKIQ